MYLDQDPYFMKWAIVTILSWRPTSSPTIALHLHGTHDITIPIRNVKNCLPIEGGSHTMVYGMAQRISEELAKVLNRQG
jgi:hypothetical protein